MELKQRTDTKNGYFKNHSALYHNRICSESAKINKGSIWFLKKRGIRQNKTKCTSIAMQPPWPKFGCIAWTESPSKVTRPLPQVKMGVRSYMSRRRIASSSVASIKSTTLSHQPSNIFSNLSFLPAKYEMNQGIDYWMWRSIIIFNFWAFVSFLILGTKFFPTWSASCSVTTGSSFKQCYLTFF